MHCPRCDCPRTAILRTRPAPEMQACGRTRICKKPGCQAIFETWEALIRVVREGPGPLTAGEILAALSRLPPADAAAVKAAIQASQ